MTPRVVAIGGIDPSGGAGLSLDARVLELHGAMALPVVTALTVQNRHGFARAVATDPDVLRASVEAAFADEVGGVAAVKIGLLAHAEQAVMLAGLLRRVAAAVPLVVDPVLSATAGGLRAAAELPAVYRRELLPLATLFTPNLPELAAIAGGTAPRELLATGCRAVLVKGGHGDGAELRDRLWLGGGDEVVFEHARLPVGPVRGTGCALGSAITARLAHGDAIGDAVAAATAWLQQCLAALAPMSDVVATDAARARPLPLTRPR